MPAPSRKLDLSAMNYFLGTWSCRRVLDANKKLVGTTIQLTITPILGGTWYRAQRKDGSLYFTQDPKTKQLIYEDIENDGDYGSGASPGWDGDVLVFKDTVSARGNPLGRTTVTRISAREFKSTYVASKPGGGTETYERICTKP
jgi:hypothetical protein